MNIGEKFNFFQKFSTNCDYIIKVHLIFRENNDIVSQYLNRKKTKDFYQN